jgi:hypothetical protein
MLAFPNIRAFQRTALFCSDLLPKTPFSAYIVDFPLEVQPTKEDSLSFPVDLNHQNASLWSRQESLPEAFMCRPAGLDSSSLLSPK